MDEKMKKQYGLILKAKKDEKKVTVPSVASVFNDDDEDDKVDVSGESRSAASLRTIKNAERMQELALAEDPSIFDYDGSYEEIERKKNQKIAEQKAKDEVRQSKYAENIIKAHARRELEQYSREERQQQKERVKEQGEYDDKEEFITGAYRKQMEEVAKFREDEAYEARFNAATDVEKQEMWQAGFSRHILSMVARTDEEDGNKDVGKEKEKDKEKKKANIRKRLESMGEDEEEEKKKTGKETEKNKKKSIYDSDDEDKGKKKKSIYDSDPEDSLPSKGKGRYSPPHKLFPTELKPGLNKPVMKTKSQAIKERMFTPSPPSSDDEGASKTRMPARRRTKSESGSPVRGRRDSNGDRERRKDSRERKSDKKENKPEKPKRKDDKELKLERFEKLKKIVARRNGPDEIEAMKARYYERKNSGFVTVPF